MRRGADSGAAKKTQDIEFAEIIVSGSASPLWVVISRRPAIRLLLQPSAIFWRTFARPLSVRRPDRASLSASKVAFPTSGYGLSEVYLNEAGDETPKSVSFGLTMEK
jgi:hypothetical protein